MPVVAGNAYDFLIMLRLSHSVPSIPGQATISVEWLNSPACDSNAIASTDYPINAMEYTNAWTRFGTRMTAPVEAAYARLSVSTSSGLSNFTTARLDDVRFGPAGSVPVGLVSFSVD